MCYVRNQARDHYHRTCKRCAEDKAAFTRANPDRNLKRKCDRPQWIREYPVELQKLVGLKEALETMLTLKKSPKEGMPQAAP